MRVIQTQQKNIRVTPGQWKRIEKKAGVLRKNWILHKMKDF